MGVTSLKDYKEKKSQAKIKADLVKVNHVLGLCIKSLSYFSFFKPIKECIVVLRSKKSVIEDYIKKGKEKEKG